MVQLGLQSIFHVRKVLLLRIVNTSSKGGSGGWKSTSTCRPIASSSERHTHDIFLWTLSIMSCRIASHSRWTDTQCLRALCKLYPQIFRSISTPFPLSAWSSSLFHCAFEDGFCQAWWTGNTSIPLQFASPYDGQEVFTWSDCLLDFGTDFPISPVQLINVLTFI